MGLRNTQKAKHNLYLEKENKLFEKIYPKESPNVVDKLV